MGHLLLGVEIALAVYGFFGLIGGTLIVSKTRVVQGTRARLLGAFALLPIVAAFTLMFTLYRIQRILTIIEYSIAIGVAILVFAIGLFLGVNPDRKRKTTDDETESVSGTEPVPEDELVPGDEPLSDDDLGADDEPESPDLVLADSPLAGDTGPESEHLDYFDTLAEHLEYFDMNPEPPDYFDTKAAQPDRAGAEPRDDLDPDPAHPNTKPPRS